MQIPPMPPQSEADEFHALTRDLYNDMVVKCPPIVDAAMQVHAMAAGIVASSEACDHVDCMRDRIRLLASTLAYSVVTERARRDGQRVPDLSAYTASEGGAFDG